jgi:hypothetical protein
MLPKSKGQLETSAIARRHSRSGEICWLYTLRNPQKLAVVQAQRQTH